MVTKAMIVAVLATLSACAPTPRTKAIAIPGVNPRITFAGGDGFSCATRVVILGAPGGRAGVAAEYAWVRANYPDARFDRQSLSTCDAHATDILDFTTAEGKKLRIYFDISDFFDDEL